MPIHKTQNVKATKTILSMNNITKSFPGVRALNKVDFSLNKGEVHALLGENGAGKSTLIKVLGGIYQADEGDIFIGDNKVSINSVHDSKGLGVSIIHQELILVPHMTIAENIFLGRELRNPITKLIDFKQMELGAQEILDAFKLNIRATDKVRTLSIAQQQMVEIAKALSVDAKIIVMDEPTATLTEKETEQLFSLIDDLKKKHTSVIYISHRMEELFRISDRVTVLRDGELVGTVTTAETDKAKLIQMMVGRNLKEFFKHSKHKRGDTLLEVKNLSGVGGFQDVSFSLKRGEILGISGIVGAGRTELVRAIFGIDPTESGEIFVKGVPVEIDNPTKAMELGLALIPENRKEEGLVLSASVGFNLTLQVLGRFLKGIRYNSKEEDALIDNYFSQLSIKASSPRIRVDTLSGGNQQKVVIAKWLATSPEILILDEPTRGIDVGAKVEIYDLINNLALQGMGIILISSELPEIINMSDRVLVMSQGRVSAEIERDEISQEKIMHYATGGL